MGTFVDRTGIKYGRLTAIKTIRGRKFVYWLCLCDCGKYTEVRASNLQSGAVKSCGCLNIESITKHNQVHSRLYNVFNSLKQRCLNPNNKEYKNYGGRGIKICKEWLDKENGFMNFYNWAMENGYNENAKFQQCTIDRIDVNGNYEPNNCRWITNKEQALNRTTNKILIYKGKSKTMVEWSKELGINYKTFQKYIQKGKNIEEILKLIKKNQELKNKRKVILINARNNEIFKEFNNAYEACLELGLKRTQTSSVYKCLCGKRNSAYGFIWRYIDEYRT